MGYSGNTRHRVQSYLLVNEAAERDAVRRSRPLNDTRDITLHDRWANVARALAYPPEKDTATALLDRLRQAKRGGVRAFQQVMPDVRQARHAAEMPRTKWCSVGRSTARSSRRASSSLMPSSGSSAGSSNATSKWSAGTMTARHYRPESLSGSVRRRQPLWVAGIKLC